MIHPAVLVALVLVGVPLALVGGVVVLCLLLEWSGRPKAFPPADGPSMIGPGDPLYGAPPEAQRDEQFYRNKL